MIERILVMDALEIIDALYHRLAVQHASTRRHAEQTAAYAVALGRHLCLPADDLFHLRHAGLLHDIGMLAVPRDLIDKVGPLTGDEYACLQSHPRLAADVLGPVAALRIPAIWIAHHHERWDGHGYPYGIAGPWIPYGARILAVADTFDALRAPRCAAPRTIDCALKLLAVLAGTQLDPNLVSAFTAVMTARDMTAARSTST
jgi:HD-GYP domain-containing protein (c-di-GMP phosphodiesterase class II)